MTDSAISNTMSPYAGEPSQRYEFSARLRGLISECADLMSTWPAEFTYDPKYHRAEYCTHQVIAWLSEFQSNPDAFLAAYNRMRDKVRKDADVQR